MALFEVTANDRRIYEEELKDFLPDKIFDVHCHIALQEHKKPAPLAPGEKKRTVTWPSLVAKQNSIEDLQETYELLFPGKTCKALVFSEPFSAMDFTGFFFPFTGEANLNVHCPAMYLGSTIVHEMAHLRGIASEQECNFLAVLVCETSGDAAYEYSGALFGFIHLSNALYRADRQAWEALHEELTMEVRMDLHYNNLYWDQFESATGDISHEVYDRFLKGYGEESGIQSYGEVVDLLVAYYGEK